MMMPHAVETPRLSLHRWRVTALPALPAGHPLRFHCLFRLTSSNRLASLPSFFTSYQPKAFV